MSRIKIKNFGPIRDGLQENDGWIDIKKVTIFIGNQGSGKSTVAKLISTFKWMEKALVNGQSSIEYFTKYNRFRKIYCAYLGIENYFHPASISNTAEIIYEGDAYDFHYLSNVLSISKRAEGAYLLPKIMYVPAERSFVSLVDNPNSIKLKSSALLEFLGEFNKAKIDLGSKYEIPFAQVQIEYMKLNDIIYLKGEHFKIKLNEASSGFHSAVPLLIVSKYLANLVNKPVPELEVINSVREKEHLRKLFLSMVSTLSTELSNDEIRIVMSELAAKVRTSAFINIVEEPELNLYPDSQRHVLNSLIEYANLNSGNKLIVTTHSPYLINYLTLSIKASQINTKKINDKLKQSLENIVPIQSRISGDEVIIYEMGEFGESMKILDTYKGLPSDSNFLNIKLEENNQLFANLLEIEAQCR